MSSVEPETPAEGTPAVGTPAVAEDVSIKEATTEKENESKPVDLEQVTNSFQEKAKNYLIDQSSHIVIPSFAKWFDMNEINSIEMKLFPDFFPKSGDSPKSIYKTAEIYKNMRDFMINVYRINPLEYLTITAVRRNLAGDVTSIIRIHQFLEKWGLINYQIDPRTKSSIVGPQYTGHFQVTLDTPRGLVPFIPEHKEILTHTSNKLPTPTEGEPEIKTEQKNPNPASIPLNLEVRRNIYEVSNDVVRNSSNTIIQYFCNVCGKDASEVRYHNLKLKSTSSNPNSTVNNAAILCYTCFEQGLFPLNFLSSDFVKLNLKADDDWSPQEVLLLLEGIEMFGSYDVNSNGINNSNNINSNANGQWDKISEFVGTKSREQCLVKFIQLPIEDRYLNRLIETKKEKPEEFNKETLIQDIVKEILSKDEGKDFIKKSSGMNLDETLKEETSLVNQITELTLEKVNVKLKNVSILESNLVKLQNQLNLERQQLLIERWSNFEKINKLKRERPDLSSVLDDLLTPIKINEVSKSINALRNGQEANASDRMDIDSNEAKDGANIPVSVAQPKEYRFWSC